MNRVKVLAIPASVRLGTPQQEVMKKLASMTGLDTGLQVYDKLADLPLHLNRQNADPTEPVVNFCQTIRAVDAVILYLPEFTFGVPGALNNALKWALPYDVFKDKFVALITTARTKNTMMQGFINDISAQLYPTATMRIYYLPHNLGPENQKAELQFGRTIQTMFYDLKHNTSKKKAAVSV